jgi:hypothetical protein
MRYLWLLILALALPSAADACRRSLQIDENEFVREIRFADLSFDGRLTEISWRTTDGDFVPRAVCSDGDDICVAGNFDRRIQADHIAEVRFVVTQWFSESMGREVRLLVDLSNDGPCAIRPLARGAEYIVTVTPTPESAIPLMDVHRTGEWPVGADQLLETQRDVLRANGLYD